MARTERIISASAEQVFAVLSNGWTYSDWVIGTAHIRSVDADWPREGSKIHLITGAWPLEVRGVTPVVRCDPPRRLVIAPTVWPLGTLEVDIELREHASGGTRVILREDVKQGPMLWTRNKLNDMLLHARNKEALRRLEDLVHGLTPDRPGDAPNR